jgi:hypothetical protein
LKFTIQIPNQSDLHVLMSAGDLKREDVRGNKGVELRLAICASTSAAPRTTEKSMHRCGPATSRLRLS